MLSRSMVTPQIGLRARANASADCAHITTGRNSGPAQSNNSIRNSDGWESPTLAGRAKVLLGFCAMTSKTSAKSTAAKVVASVNFPGREALAYLRGQERAMVRVLGEFVRCESFSYEKKA